MEGELGEVESQGSAHSAHSFLYAELGAWRIGTMNQACRRCASALSAHPQPEKQNAAWRHKMISAFARSTR